MQHHIAVVMKIPFISLAINFRSAVSIIGRPALTYFRFSYEETIQFLKSLILAYPKTEKYNILAIGFILQVDTNANMCCSSHETAEKNHDTQCEMAYHHQRTK